MASRTDTIRSEVGHLVDDVQRIDYKKALQPPYILTLPILLLYLFMFFGSMLTIVILSFQPENTINLGTWTLANYLEVWASETYLNILWETFQISLVTTVLTLVFSYPVAYALARKIDRFNLPLLLALVVPLFTGVNIRSFGWFLFLAEEGVLASVADVFGVQNVPNLLFQKLTVILGTTYIYMPFMLFPIFLSILTISDDLFVAANDLGASKYRVFRSLVLPLSAPGVLIGSLFVFVLSLGASVEASYLGGGTVITMASNIEYSFGYLQNWPLGAAQAVGLLIVSTIAGIVIIQNIDFETIAGRE